MGSLDFRDLGRLPRHRGEPAPAVGPCGAARARAGRARRQRGCARPVLHAASPRSFSGGGVEAAILDHENPRVLDGHVAAAAFEAADRRSRRRDPRGRGSCAGPRSIPSWRRRRPATSGQAATTRRERFGLPLDEPRRLHVVTTDTGSVLGTIERDRAYSTVHEGAIYLHLGESYRVVRARPPPRGALSSR